VEWPSRAALRRCSAAAIGLATLREIDQNIRTSDRIPFGNHFRVGFLGRCDYALPPDASVDALRALRLLTAYAFFSGVGVKTTMGMGQVVGELIDRRREKSRSRGR
jgi:CRISPR/Cas system CMR-associated protein Cmr1 (group 7 of RAMP superfamily)